MDQQVMVNGMSVTSLTGTGGTRTNWSDGTAQEHGLQLAHSAEIAYGGVFANILPRDGGNRLSGDLFANFANEDFQADNLDADLRSQGLTVVNKTKKMVDVNPSVGGPLLPTSSGSTRPSATSSPTTTLAVFTTTRRRRRGRSPRICRARPSAIRLPTTRRSTYVADVAEQSARSSAPTTTCVSLLLDQSDGRRGRDLQPGRQQHRARGRWTSTLSSKLLVEAGASHYLSPFPRKPSPTRPNLRSSSSPTT